MRWLWCIAAAFLTAGHLTAAGDLYFDFGEKDSPPVRELSADPAAKRDAELLASFAKLYSGDLLTGKAAKANVDELFQLLERDPDATDLLFLLFGIMESTPDLVEYSFDRLIRLAEKTGSAQLCVHAGARAQDHGNWQKSKEFLRITYLAWKDLPRNGYENADLLQKQLFSAMLANLKMAAIMTDDRELLEELENYLQENRHIRDGVMFQKDLFYTYVSTVVQLRGDPLKRTLFQVQYTHILARLDKAAQDYLDALNRDSSWTQDIRTHSICWDHLNEMGRTQELLYPLLRELTLKNGNDQQLLLALDVTLRKSERFADAARVLGITLKKFPRSPQSVYQSYLRTLLAAGFYRKALRVCDALSFTSKKNRAQYIGVAIRICLDMKDLPGAKRRLSLLPEGLYKYRLELLTYHTFEDYDAAYETAAKALIHIRKFKLSVRDRQFWMLCALAADARKDLAMLEAILLPQITANPKDATMLNHLGYTYAVHNVKLDQAEDLLKRALQLEPDSPEFLDSMAWILYRKKDFVQAKKYILKSISQYHIKYKGRHIDATLLDHAGDIFHALGDMTQARFYWTRALMSGDTGPDTPDPAVIRKKLEQINPKKK